MSARMFAEWQAYCSIEPFGPVAEFWRAAMIASMIANVNRAKNQKAYSPEDFMPAGLMEKPVVDDPDALVRQLKARNEAQRLMRK